MLGKLQQLADCLCNRSGFKFHVTVKAINSRVDPKEECYALWSEETHTIWVRLQKSDGQLYTIRHLRSCIIHELAHHTAKLHNNSFRTEQRRLAKLARKRCA